jgi:hypothetical protein
MSLKRIAIAMVLFVLVVTMVASALFLRLPGAKPVSLQPDEPARIDLVTSSQNITVECGDTFSLNVTFQNIPTTLRAAGFEFTLNWSASIVQAVSMEEILFHSITPQAEWGNIWQIRNRVHNESVEYAFTWSDIEIAHSMGYCPVNITDGTLATIEFKSLAKGETTLHFDPEHTMVGDDSFPISQEIPTVKVDGDVTVVRTRWILKNIVVHNKPYNVTVFTNLDAVGDYGFNDSLSQIFFSGTSSQDWFCNVVVPRKLFRGPMNVSIDGTPVPSILTWNSDYAFVYFVSNSSRIVTIAGEYLLGLGDLNGDGVINILDAIILSNHFLEHYP